MTLGRNDVQLTEAEARSLRILQKVCGAIMAACVVLAGVGYAVSQLPGPAQAVDPVVSNVLLGAALVPLVASSVLRGVLLRGGNAQAAPVQRWFIAVLVSFALREAAAVVGLVVTILTREPVWAAALAGMAVMGMGLAFPTTERYSDWRRGL